MPEQESGQGSVLPCFGMFCNILVCSGRDHHGGEVVGEVQGRSRVCCSLWQKETPYRGRNNVALYLYPRYQI